MKKLLSFLIIAALILTLSISVYAEDGSNTESGGTVVEIEYLENGDYIETVLENETIIIPSDATATTVTKTKVKNYKNSAGTILWSIKVQGTFTYNGTTCSCTNAEHQATSYASTWTIISASHSRRGNAATATATARHTSGVGYDDYTRSVTLRCSPTGEFT